MLAEFRGSRQAIEFLVNRPFLSKEARRRYLMLVAGRSKALQIEWPLRFRGDSPIFFKKGQFCILHLQLFSRWQNIS